jgi:hypothetical protein
MACGTAVGAASPELNLYEGTVAGDASGEPRGSTLADALRQVAVRATGRRAAATASGLAPLYANARRYVETLKPAGPGLVTVGFDAASVEAQLAQAGEPLWDRDRPQTLILFVSATTGQAVETAESAAARHAIEQAAQLRGVIVRFASHAQAEQLSVRLEDLKRGEAGSLVELARRYGAEEALVGIQSGTAIQYAAYGRVGLSSLPVAADEALHALVDRYAQDQALAPGTSIASLKVDISGIRDARSYALARRALESLSVVRAVSLADAAGDVVHVTVSLRGGSDALRHALNGAAHLALESAPGTEPVRLRLVP